jgi:hypothetical protein
MLHLLANLQEGDARADWDALERLSKTTSAIDASRLDNRGEAALHIVAKHCCSGVGPVFFDAFYENPNSEEPLWNPVIALLESFGTPVDIQTAGGVTPLHLACQKGILSFVDYLLAQGANARVRDNSGRTVLHWLCGEFQVGQQRRAYIFNRLAESMNLEDIEAKDVNNQTADDLAAKFDALYIECERRIHNNLNPDPRRPPTPYPESLSKMFLATWHCGFKCEAFIPLPLLINAGLKLIKDDFPQAELDELHEYFAINPEFKHWLEKQRQYHDSRRNA